MSAGNRITVIATRDIATGEMLVGNLPLDNAALAMVRQRASSFAIVVYLKDRFICINFWILFFVNSINLSLLCCSWQTYGYTLPGNPLNYVPINTVLR